MSRTFKSGCRAFYRAGFTLIELMAVVVIIGILMIYLLPKIPAAFDAAKVTACKTNMKSIYEGMTLYYGKYNHLPTESGVRFFTSLITDEVWENSTTYAKTLTCPGVETAALPGLHDLEPKEWFAEPAILDGTFSSYAGRNMKEHALRRWPPENASMECLVADDNVDGENHDTATVALFADGHIQAFEIVEERKKGRVGPEETTIAVGPDSPIEELSKLSLD
jgi:prepilin-type N-terminal cleavage/methylation domain-containing protein